MDTENDTATRQHVRLPADDPTTEALATYLVREEQRGLRDALLTAASLVAIARGFSAWINRNQGGDSSTSRPTGLYRELELPVGFEYFERTSEVPVIDAAPAWHHLDETRGAEAPESPHAAIVREVFEDHTNAINVEMSIAVTVAMVAVLIRVATDRYFELEWLRPWSSWVLGFAATVAIALAFVRRIARRVGRKANDRIMEHDALQAARALRLEFEDSNAWTSEPDDDS